MHEITNSPVSSTSFHFSFVVVEAIFLEPAASLSRRWPEARKMHAVNSETAIIVRVRSAECAPQCVCARECIDDFLYVHSALFVSLWVNSLVNVLFLASLARSALKCHTHTPLSVVAAAIGDSRTQISE